MSAASGTVPSDVRTAEIRGPSRGRRIGTWIAIVVALLIVGGVGAALSSIGDWTQRDALDPESAAPAGTRALAEILREQGIDVVVARDRATAAAQLATADATLVLPDAPALSDDAVTALTDAAAHVVLIEPRARTLRLLLPGAMLAGYGDGTPVAPGCDVAEAVRSGPVAPGALYTAPGSASNDVAACYPSGTDAAPGADAGLLVGIDGERTVAAVDGRSIFVNETLADDGNAALAINLMGRNAVVVWYAPSLADTDLPQDASLGELTPPWVSPVIVLLIAAAVAAGIWRGRRFGPLVAERLPVTVRVAETTEGRARLYAHARDAAHAAEQLRAGTLTRLARALGLAPTAAASVVADAVAARTGLDRARVRGILIDDPAASDRDLVALRDRLHALEDAAHAAARPERNDR